MPPWHVDGNSRGRILGSIFAGYVPLASQSPYPIIVYSVANYRHHLSHFGQMCSFCYPNLVTFYLCMYLTLNKEHLNFHLQYKHSGTFANRTFEELSCLKNQKMCDPILVNLLKMRPYDSESSGDNATPLGGTYPLASYKEVLPPGMVTISATCVKETNSPYRKLTN